MKKTRDSKIKKQTIKQPTLLVNVVNVNEILSPPSVVAKTFSFRIPTKGIYIFQRGQILTLDFIITTLYKTYGNGITDKLLQNFVDNYWANVNYFIEVKATFKLEEINKTNEIKKE